MAVENDGANIEMTLAMVKPDGVAMNFIPDIRERYEAAGLEVVSEHNVHFSKTAAASFYQDHEGKFYFAGLILALSSGLSKVFILRGRNAIQKVRDTNGDKDPAEAKPGTIRHDFRSAGGPFNTVHGSDSQKSFRHEHSVVKMLTG